MSKTKRKWIIVSNRLPFQINPNSGQIEAASGGLVSAITSIGGDQRKIWVGTAPEGMSSSQLSNKSVAGFEGLIPVFPSEKLYDGYYNCISNDVIWPLFHYESQLVKFDWSAWKSYVRVNEMFAEAIAKVAGPDDLVWIHDYHLLLLPRMLKKKNKRLKVGFFLHIPFPSSEVFRQLPARDQILEAMLSSDLIGFHDYSYLRHFCTTLSTVKGIESSLLTVKYGKHTARLGVFPVSIDTGRFEKKAASAEVKKVVKQYKKDKNYEKLLLGVDRLDYIKGIELKLKAFQQMLRSMSKKKAKKNIKKIALLQIAVPTRTDVDEYVHLKQEVDKLVGEINGEFGEPNFVPVRYIYSSVDFTELVALYRLADLLLVTSKRDGMNLVALEYIASQSDINPGAVVLSEFAGAISTLSHVTSVNPWDIDGTAQQMSAALEISQVDRVLNNRKMKEYLKKYTATDWASSFMSSLETSGDFLSDDNQVALSSGSGVSIPADLKRKAKDNPVLVMLDYDGTLVPIQESAKDAVLGRDVKSYLKTLIKNKNIHLVVVSGRDSKFLTEQMKGLNISIAAEHGAKFFSATRSKWESLVHSNKQSWYPLALKIMNDYTSRVPGSFVEKKEFAISWHYRKSPAEFGDYQARKIKEELELGLSNLPVTILAGKKVIEARAIEANKGSFARWYIESRFSSRNRNQQETELIVALGDDQTDEDLFASVPDDGVTVKVGEGTTGARYRLHDQKDVLPFLKKMTGLK